MPEAYEQEEMRQLEWDRKCAAAPRCSCCGGSVYPYDTYSELDRFIFCEKCMSGFNTFCTEDLELGD